MILVLGNHSSNIDCYQVVDSYLQDTKVVKISSIPTHTHTQTKTQQSKQMMMGMCKPVETYRVHLRGGRRWWVDEWAGVMVFHHHPGWNHTQIHWQIINLHYHRQNRNNNKATRLQSGVTVVNFKDLRGPVTWDQSSYLWLVEVVPPSLPDVVELVSSSESWMISITMFSSSSSPFTLSGLFSSECDGDVWVTGGGVPLGPGSWSEGTGEEAGIKLPCAPMSARRVSRRAFFLSNWDFSSFSSLSLACKVCQQSDTGAVNRNHYRNNVIMRTSWYIYTAGFPTGGRGKGGFCPSPPPPSPPSFQGKKQGWMQ